MVTFRRCIIPVFLVLFDEMRINQNGLYALIEEPTCQAKPVVASGFHTNDDAAKFVGFE
ncbi:hypothetical protein D3C73_1306620 [compost metagenome]